MSSEVLISFGIAVRQIRLEKKISQEAFADMCGLHRTYISGVELGKRNISLENIEKIANAFGMTVSQLFRVIEDSKHAIL